MTCYFVSDLHGSESRYESLVAAIRERRPEAIFIGGDLLPGGASLKPGEEFFQSYLSPLLRDTKRDMGSAYPAIFALMGNDDPIAYEPEMRRIEDEGLWYYAHNRAIPLGHYTVYGYACIPPTPFRLKDWERYDVSRYIDPGDISPEDGVRSVPVEPNRIRYGTIARDLNELVGDADLNDAIFLFHAPPYRTNLDRAGLDGRTIDHVPLDVHVGSIAVKKFVEARQPMLTLHGHIHESARIMRSWRDRVGRTHLFGAGHDGSELALVVFDLADLEGATRELL